VEGGKKALNTRELSLVAVYAALYASLVIVFSPISFGVLQFRLAGVVRPGIARMRVLAVGYAIGVVVGNLMSPFAGIYELLLMPVASLAAGLIGYELAKRLGGSYWTCGLVIAVIIPVCVSWMLLQLFSLPVGLTLPGLLASELIINVLGAGIFTVLERRMKW
jgi:uncharacterized membrane protein